MTREVYLKCGDTGLIKLGYSEVVSHLRIAGQTVRFIFLGTCVQIQTIDSVTGYWENYSFPVLPYEAGLHWDNDIKAYYQYSDRISLDPVSERENTL